MEIELYLDASAQQVADYLRSLRPDPDGKLASWEVESYQVHPGVVGTAPRLSILAGLRRPGEVDLLMVQVLLQELRTDRCKLSLSANPTLTTTAEGEEAAAHGWEPEKALYAWLLGKAQQAWPELGAQLEALALKSDVTMQKRRARGTSSATDVNAREAARLYSNGLTEQAIAERMVVNVRTVKRWRKRAEELPRTK